MNILDCLIVQSPYSAKPQKIFRFQFNPAELQTKESREGTTKYIYICILNTTNKKKNKKLVRHTYLYGKRRWNERLNKKEQNNNIN